MSMRHSRDGIFVGGKWAMPKPAEKIDVISAFSENVVATVQREFKEDVDAAVSAARRDIGPMVSNSQREDVEHSIGIGIKEGAKVVVGGFGRSDGLSRGWLVRPTLFAGVDPNSRLAQEEIFGSVVSILAFDDEEHAVDIANNSIYGLSGSVFSQDFGKAIAVADQVKTGVVEINGAPFGFNAPFGGGKQSGTGREKRVGRF